MKLIFLEMKKSWLKLPILIMLIILSLLNFYKLSEVYRLTGNFGGRDSADIKKAYSDIYDNYLRGEITPEKIEYVKNEYQKYKAEVNSGDFSKEYDISRLTGYVYSDYALYEFYIVPQLEYAVTYPNISNRITQRAHDNIAFFTEHTNTAKAEENRYIEKLYKERMIFEFNLTEWVRIFFEYDFSSLLILIMIIIGLASNFSGEYESGMNSLICSSGSSGRTVNAKLASAAVYIMLLTVYFTVIDFISTKSLCGADGLSNPIYYAEYFQNSPYTFSFFTGIILCAAVKFLAFCFIGEIIMLISVISKNSVISLCAGFLSVVAMILCAEQSTLFIDPINMLGTGKFIKEFGCIDFFGKPVLELNFFIFVYIILIAVFAVIIKASVKRSMTSVKK